MDTTPPPPSGNTPPTITGSAPSAITIGTAYSFTPSANDPDNDPLTFSIDNLPVWASFDQSTGRLSGTPTLGNVGEYSQIQINVSDGSASASLPRFSVSVTDVALGSLSISWSAPTVNTDGSPLTDLAGYKIYFGTTQGVYTNVIRIDNPSIDTYLVENLIPDTYYLVGTSLNQSGIESDFTSVAVRVVQ